MCGIAGVFGANGEAVINRMLETLRHRGPDDEYFIAEEDFTLGVRRLSIIDLEGGRQPIPNETEEIWVAQNGEIYNYQALTEALKREGHTFRTRSDTEVLAHLYEEKGEKFINDLSGMYAIAVWDRKKKRGILARDRAGKKPLYYYVSGSGSLYFASEIKALLTLPFVDRSIQRHSLHHFLSYKHIPAPLSIYEGIRCLPPAHYLLFSSDKNGGYRITLERYWRLNFRDVWTIGLSENEIVEVLLNSLRKAVQARLISDVPIGFFLSGGIDSGLCAAMGATLSSHPIETFTLAYGRGSTNPAKDRDREWAAFVARRYGAHHHEELIEHRHLEEEIWEILGQFDEPFAGVISTYFLARVISHHLKVAISGDGADELFGSYLSHRLALPMEAYLENRMKGLSTPEVDNLDDSDKEILKEVAETEDWRWRHKLMVFSEDEKNSLYSVDAAAQVKGISSLEHLKFYFSQLTAQDPLNRVLEAEFNSQLPDQVLTYVDRLSMVHSLEVRAPYLDHHFLEIGAGIEGPWKIRSGQCKYILKKAALRYLPEELVLRPKEGFLLPINQWLLHNMETYVRASLSPERLKRHNFFNVQYVQNLLNNFYRGDVRLGNKLWVLITFQIWFESSVEGARCG